MGGRRSRTVFGVAPKICLQSLMLDWRMVLSLALPNPLKAFCEEALRAAELSEEARRAGCRAAGCLFFLVRNSECCWCSRTQSSAQLFLSDHLLSGPNGAFAFEYFLLFGFQNRLLRKL